MNKSENVEFIFAQVDAALPALMDAFNLPDDIRAFIFDQYLPDVGY